MTAGTLHEIKNADSSSEHPDHAKPKMLEYNADTPSLQLETGIFSEEWF